MKNATEPKGLSRRVLALVTALLLTLSLLPGSFAVSAEETASDTFYVDGSAAASGDGLTRRPPSRPSPRATPCWTRPQAASWSCPDRWRVVALMLPGPPLPAL